VTSGASPGCSFVTDGSVTLGLFSDGVQAKSEKQSKIAIKKANTFIIVSPLGLLCIYYIISSQKIQ
jgi:hypothetical protein